MQTSPIAVATARPSSFVARDLCCLTLLAISSLVAWRQIAALLRLAWTTDEYTHILLILPVSLSLLYLERNKLHRSARYAVIEGTILAVVSLAVAIGAIVCFRGFAEGILLALLIFALVMSWMAWIISCYGRTVFAGLLFPFLFLFLLVPAPPFVLDKAVVFLQGASTEATYALFNLVRLPVLKNGFILSFPSLRIEVAKECSGIRSSIMLLITGLILSHLFLRSLWSKIVFVLFIVPLSVAKNAIRIFTLSMLGMYVDPGFLYGSLHHQGGIVFFLIALGGLMAMLFAMQKIENKSLKKLNLTAD
jgi:exosortase